MEVKLGHEFPATIRVRHQQQDRRQSCARGVCCYFLLLVLLLFCIVTLNALLVACQCRSSRSHSCFLPCCFFFQPPFTSLRLCTLLGCLCLSLLFFDGSVQEIREAAGKVTSLYQTGGYPSIVSITSNHVAGFLHHF